MNYVEWLRVRGCLKWTTIVLLIMVAIVGIARLAMLAFGAKDGLTFVSSIESDPTSQTSHVTLPDGTARTTIVNRQRGVTIVVDDRGSGGKSIRIVESKQRAAHRATGMIFAGQLDIDSEPMGKNQSVTTIRTGGPTDIGMYFIVAGIVSLIVATILGAPFARENDGHLEIAWTKPVAREPLAIATIGVDLAGILGAFVITMVCLFAGHLIFEVPHFVLGPYALIGLAVCLAGSAAWYGILCAATASLKRGYGVVIGFAWPVALVIAGLGHIDPSQGALAAIIHTVVTPLVWLDPLTYLHVGSGADSAGGPAQMSVVTLGHDATILAILAVAYLALAVVQWRRVEA